MPNPIRPPSEPSVPNPEINPGRPQEPEIYPQRSPGIPKRLDPDILPGDEPGPEIWPQRSPDATPPQPPTEIPPLHNPISSN
jgi:hypothetical protein